MPEPLILALTLLYLWNIVLGAGYLAGLVWLYGLIGARPEQSTPPGMEEPC